MNMEKSQKATKSYLLKLKEKDVNKNTFLFEKSYPAPKERYCHPVTVAAIESSNGDTSVISVPNNTAKFAANT